MITRNLPIKAVLQFSIVPLSIAVLWSSGIVCAYYFLELKWLAIPFLPVSVVGIAVSFYLGFKNNASSERQNEARKNWGGITNDSRAWLAMLNTYLPSGNADAEKTKRSMLRRHIAWLYAHKSFLRHTRMAWEHDKPINNRYRAMFRENFNINLELEKDLNQFLDHAEVEALNQAPNPASRLLQNQSQAIKHLREAGHIDDFRMFELQNHMTKLFEHQGRNERIKNFPIPRQFASYASLFVKIFTFLIPFGLLKETQDISVWLTIPFATLISWVFFQMELVGEYTEHPYEGLIGDVPMTAITRNIEIEFLSAMGETNLPKPIAAVNGILM